MGSAAVASSSSDVAISALHEKHEKELENLTLTTQPLNTLKLFLEATFVYFKRSISYLLAHGENSDVRVEGVMTKHGVNEETEIVERLKESDADASNLETSGLDTSSNRGKSQSQVDRVEDGELVQNISKLFKGSASREVKEDEKAEANDASEA